VFVVIMQGAVLHGPHTTYFVDRLAKSATEALDSAKMDLAPYFRDKLEAGDVPVEILECITRYELACGEPVSKPLV